MKRMVCASQASTAICSSTDASSVQLGGRALDRHNPIIRDAKRSTRTLPSNPCTSQPPPINPVPYHQLKKNEKKGLISCKSSNDHARKSTSSSVSVSAKLNDHKKNKKKKNSSLKPTDLVTPPGSTRYLLGDNSNSSRFSDGIISDFDSVSSLVRAETKSIQALKQDESVVSIPSSPSTLEKPSKDQVVVLRVSLHCKGCEKKMSKHISRMEGVTSYSVDFKAKKVTIVGDVTPLSVLASVSKIKSAQFWTSALAAAASSANTMNK